MKIDCISDLHGYEPNLTGGDLLLLCGDYTKANTLPQWAQFFRWLKYQDYRKKILIAGNHDGFFQTAYSDVEEPPDEDKDLLEDAELEAEFEYLCDSGTEFEGLKIWGSPWSVWLHGIHPKCKSFMDSESKLQKKFEAIPADIDILMTHTPPYLVLDTNQDKKACGSIQLRHQLDTRIFPRFHFFGHIHENHGQSVIFKKPGNVTERNTLCCNVSVVDENYKFIDQIRTIHWNT